MNLIPSLILFLATIEIVYVLGGDTFQNRMLITKFKIQQSNVSRPSKEQGLIRTLFNRS